MGIIRQRQYILAIDPSLTAFGYVVMRSHRVVTAGCIKTQSNAKKLRIRVGDDRMARIALINRQLRALFKQYNIVLIVAELPHGSQSAVAATALGIVAGAVQTIADFTETPIEWYSEQDAKKCMLGKTTAQKHEMITAVTNLYGSFQKTNIKYRDEAMADAISIYHTARTTGTALQLIQQA